MAEFPEKLLRKLELRTSQDALRNLVDRRGLIDFSSNDYLGLTQEASIFNAAESLLNQLGIQEHGATGSRLLTGNHELYTKLESFLAQHHYSEAALVFNSGYDANVGFFASVPQRGDVVLFDELIHASIRDGIKMGNAKGYKFKHNDFEDLLNQIGRLNAAIGDGELYVVTESVFSMDGDSPDLKTLIQLCGQNGCRLIIDEAHATGIYGGGKDLISEKGLQDEVFARIITFGKALGCHGAAILGSQMLKKYLVNFARSLVYTTGLPPHAIALIWASYQFLDEDEGHKIAVLKENIQYFKDQIQHHGLAKGFISSDSAIHCLVVPGNENVKVLAHQLNEAGFDVKPILSPTVKKGEERLRFCLHAFNTKEEILQVLRETKKNLR